MKQFKEGEHTEVWISSSISTIEKVKRKVSMYRSDIISFNGGFDCIELSLWYRRVHQEYIKLKNSLEKYETATTKNYT